MAKGEKNGVKEGPVWGGGGCHVEEEQGDQRSDKCGGAQPGSGENGRARPLWRVSRVGGKGGTRVHGP
jgi:hypothetical protein